MTNLYVLIGGIVAILGAIGAAVIQTKGKAKAKAENKELKDTLKRQARGRDAVAEEQSESTGLSNSDIVDRMRRRDGDFRGL